MDRKQGPESKALPEIGRNKEGCVLKLTGPEIHALIKERKESQAQVRAEARVGEYKPPPPLLAGLTHIADIKPPKPPSKAQAERNRQDRICTIERCLKNSKLTPTERTRLEETLAKLAGEGR